MSETLLAIVFVTSSAKGSSLVYRWPPSPESPPRLARPRPVHDVTCAQGDNPWRASNASDAPSDDVPVCVCPDTIYCGEDEEYIWKRPNINRDRSLSFSHSRSDPSSRKASPSKEANDGYSLDVSKGTSPDDGYDKLLGYNAEFLAGLLCPQSSMCHQKFELLVDDLAFIGHPVCAEPDGAWRFKADKVKMAPRGRVSKKGESQTSLEKSLTPETNEGRRPVPDTAWLQTFHFVLILDRPDPSSAASGSLWKYYDTVYEQIAFTITAILYQEQILHNFVETECDTLGALKDDFITRGETFSNYMAEALQCSSLAPAMKTLYEAIKEGSIARVTIHDIPLELQLPPYLDSLLHADDDTSLDDVEQEDEYSIPNAWSPDMSFAQRLPALTPWKSLLLVDDDDEQAYELYMRLRAPQLTMEDREVAEQLIRFLDLASITLSLADMASLLDWDLESQVYPIVRWLVHHRRAKLVDIVHPGLKTIFAVPQNFSAPLSKLTSDFSNTFSQASVPPLPKLLSMVSMAEHRQGANHFFATIVRSKSLIPLYHDVVVWLLKRDLLLTLHLRIRIVATEALKERVRMEWELARARREREKLAKEREPHVEQGELAKVPESSPVANWFSLSPRSARRVSRRLSGTASASAKEEQSRSLRREAAREEKRTREEDEDEFVSSGTEDLKWEDWFHGEGRNPHASMIYDPARATPLERRWLAAMSDGKDTDIARRFEQINQYFDGKCTDDEILFRAEISRKQLREVLHHYEEYLQTFLHPS
ncbi:predicted protein [Sparassis crispa]|uniref:Nitrogen permease regulator 3 n=1 Tax=Sparassis crispa TaxID=139825 RepID=A0A401H1Q0_9APHY|nr:predicted protein [Sparassis crispa]GBE88319.1 predicted protein [Sparassis crispa]